MKIKSSLLCYVQLRSARLEFRRIEESDFDTVAKIMRDEGVRKVWEHYFTDDDVRDWIARRQEGYLRNGTDYLLAINVLSREVVGQIGLLKEEIDGEEVWAIDIS